MALERHEVQALTFLREGPDQPGVIDTEEKLAATLVFCELAARGLVHNTPHEGGPVFSISAEGVAALAAYEAAP